jgi:phosphoadenosine phosphosulfate reductase
MSAIELHARRSDGFDARVANAVALLRSAARDHEGRVVQATSLGAEDMVVTDMISRHDLPIAVATLDTRLLHAQTLALIPAIKRRYRIDVERFSPRDETVVHFVRANGERAMFQSVELRKACCAVRKLEPLSRMLERRSAWITGMRREQSANRGAVAFSEPDAEGRAKFNPLADWTLADVWHYIAANEVPYNALHDQFYPSIGCAPCTRAIAAGEDLRSGRWWWEQEKTKECGLHLRDRSTRPGQASGAQA